MTQIEFKQHINNWIDGIEQTTPEQIDETIRQFMMCGDYDSNNDTHRANVMAAKNFKMLLLR